MILIVPLVIVQPNRYLTTMTTTTDFLSHLNFSQRIAVEHFCGPLLVVAEQFRQNKGAHLLIVNLIQRQGRSRKYPGCYLYQAKREMKERIQKLFAEQLAVQEYGQPFELLADSESRLGCDRASIKSSSKIYGLAPSTASFSRILRFDIEKYQDEKDAGIATFPLTSPMQIALLNKLSLNS